MYDKIHHLLEHLTRYCNNIYDIDDVIEFLEKYNKNYKTHYNFEYGCARCVIICKNTVIKWDRNEEAVKECGGCENEYHFYHKAYKDGFSYLFAPIKRIIVNGIYFYLSPFINNIGYCSHKGKEINNFCTMEEFCYITNNITDLHHNNWGIQNNHVIIIDYAYPAY